MSIMLFCLPDGLVFAVAEAGGAPRPRSRPGMTPSASTQPPDDRELVDARLMQRVARGDKQASSVFRSLLPWAAAACLALAAGWLAQLHFATRGEIALLHNQQALANLALKSARNQLEAERILAQRQISDLNQQLKAQGDLADFKIATLTSMPDHSPQALAVAVWNPAKQEGVFTIEKMPALAADQDYQLWVIDPKLPQPVSAGVFTVGPGGAARVQFKTEAPVAAVAKFAVSREKKGGAPAHAGPQGQVIMISQ